MKPPPSSVPLCVCVASLFYERRVGPDNSKWDPLWLQMLALWPVEGQLPELVITRSGSWVKEL
jgi:hypothetical protein